MIWRFIIGFWGLLTKQCIANDENVWVYVDVGLRHSNILLSLTPAEVLLP